MEFNKKNLLKDLENLESDNSNDVTQPGIHPPDTDSNDVLLFGRDAPDFFQDYIKFANKMIYQNIPQRTLT
jgi:hypothetical protein